MSNRMIVMGGVWANGAPDVPVTPTPLTTYRNSGLSEADIEDAWKFSKIVNSADFNEVLYRLTSLMKQIEVGGILNWCESTPYILGGLAYGSDGILYRAVQANSGQDPVSDSTGTYWVNSNSPGYMIIVDQKNSGTSGGTSVSGVQIRTLNTVSSNTIRGASLASNTITLPVGIYRVRGSVPASEVQGHIAYLYDSTNNLTLILGTTENATIYGGVYDSRYNTNTRSLINGRIVLTATTNLQIKHHTNQAIPTSGLGAQANSWTGNNIYTQIEIVKEF